MNSGGPGTSGILPPTRRNTRRNYSLGDLLGGNGTCIGHHARADRAASQPVGGETAPQMPRVPIRYNGSRESTQEENDGMTGQHGQASNTLCPTRSDLVADTVPASVIVIPLKCSSGFGGPDQLRAQLHGSWISSSVFASFTQYVRPLRRPPREQVQHSDVCSRHFVVHHDRVCDRANKSRSHAPMSVPLNLLL